MKTNHQTATILLIDDDPYISEVTELILTEEGYQVITDLEGNYFSKPTAKLPDLILLDLLITGTSGEHIAKKLKSQPQTQDIPVIILSAQTPAELQTVCHTCHADTYISKPYDINELLQTVAQLLHS